MISSVSFTSSQRNPLITITRNTVLTTRPDLNDEGIAFAEDAFQQPGDTAVYRFFDTQFGTHFYAADPSEIRPIQTTRPDLKPEGAAFYEPS